MKAYNCSKLKSNFNEVWINRSLVIIQNTHDITFNGKKSSLIMYNKYNTVCIYDPGIFINNVKVPWVSEVIYLGECLNEDIYKFGANKCVEDFNRQCNMF